MTSIYCSRHSGIIYHELSLIDSLRQTPRQFLEEEEQGVEPTPCLSLSVNCTGDSVILRPFINREIEVGEELVLNCGVTEDDDFVAPYKAYFDEEDWPFPYEFYFPYVYKCQCSATRNSVLGGACRHNLPWHLPISPPTNELDVFTYEELMDRNLHPEFPEALPDIFLLVF